MLVKKNLRTCAHRAGKKFFRARESTVIIIKKKKRNVERLVRYFGLNPPLRMTIYRPRKRPPLFTPRLVLSLSLSLLLFFFYTSCYFFVELCDEPGVEGLMATSLDRLEYVYA